LEIYYITLGRFILWEKLDDYAEYKNVENIDISIPQVMDDIFENHFKIKVDDINHIKENLVDVYL